MTEKQSHVLIDTYLRKPWHVRLGSFFFKFLILLVVLVILSYYVWRLTPPENQAAWREQFPVLEQAASFLEAHKLIPSTAEQLAIKEQKLVAEIEKELAESDENNRVWDLRDPSMMGDDKPDRKKLPVSTQEKIFEMKEIDENGNVVIHPVTKKEGDQLRINGGSKLAVDQANATPDQIGNPHGYYVMKDGKKRFVSREEIETRKNIVDLDQAIVTREREERRQKFAKMLSNGGDTISWKVWDDRHPVTWDDFRIVDPDVEDSRWGAYIRSNIAISYNQRSYTFFAYMVPEGSWCRPGIRTEKTLKHERLHFDISELITRRIRALVANQTQDSGYSSAVQKIISSQFKELGQMQHHYDRETYNSRNDEAQARWNEEIGKALEASQAWKWVPDPKNLAIQKYDIGYFLLGQTYDLGGPHYEKSPRLARKWYDLAINKEKPEAMNNLAVLLSKEAQGDASKYKKAFTLFRRAAEKGTPTAQFNLGVAYWRGLGTEVDHEKAMEWFTVAAEQNPYARHALKIMESEERPQLETKEQ